VEEYIRILKELQKADMKKLNLKENDGAITVSCEGREVAVISCDPAAPQICQLLQLWAKARLAEAAPDPEREKAAAVLRAMIPGLKAGKNIPVKEVMTQLVFPKQNSSLATAAMKAFQPIWVGYSEAMKKYREVSASHMKTQHMQCQAKSTMILRLQYDNIDRQEEGQSIRTRNLRLFDRIVDTFSAVDEQPETLKKLFSPDCVEDYWLYRNEESRNEILNGEEFKEFPDRELLTNFREKGYMLLYYALRAAQLQYRQKKAISEMAEKSDNTYYASYCGLLADAMVKHMSDSAAKRLVLEQCRQDLMEAAEKNGITTTGDLFRQIYTSRESENKMLWQIFTWDEIKACIGENEYVR
jgi:hypothetical protein